MDAMFFLKGVIIGFIVAAPIGPIGILCVNRTLANGRMSGFMSGLGAVTGDGFYAVVAAYSVTVISAFLSEHYMWFRLAGGVFLFYLGRRVFMASPGKGEESKGAGTLIGDYVSTVCITIANPVTVIAFAAVFAGIGLGSERSGVWSPAAIVGGVLTGAVFCWFVLSGLVNAFRDRFDLMALKTLNKGLGSLILLFAAVILFSAFKRPL